jgi:hypothetical protein
MTAMKVLIAVLIVFAILAALALLLYFTWVRLRVVYDDDEGLRVWLEILFFRYRILPRKKEKVKLRDYKIKRFRRLERKRAKKAEKERLKKEKQQLEKKEEGIVSRELPLTQKISFITRLVGRIIRRFARYLHIDVSKLYIKVASDDAAKTAYLYSATSQLVAYLTELLMSETNFDVKKDAEFGVYPDFSVEEPEFSADFTFRVRVIDIPRLGDFGANLFTGGKAPQD